jgi:hypothetical protein
MGYNTECLTEFETVFDREVEAIANILQYMIDNEIPGNLTIHSDLQAGTAPGQELVIRVVKAVQIPHQRGWHTQIDWVPGYIRIAANERADQLAGEAGSNKQNRRTPIAYLKEQFPNTIQWPKI